MKLPVNAILVNLNSCVKALVPSLNPELPSSEVFSVSLPEQEELDAHHLLKQVGRVHVQLGAPVHHVHAPVCAHVLLYNCCFLKQKKGEEIRPEE